MQDLLIKNGAIVVVRYMNVFIHFLYLFVKLSLPFFLNKRCTCNYKLYASFYV